MTDYKFKGFDLPRQNWSKLPHAFVDELHRIGTVAEVKVILYVLRHTWGYGEYGKPKRITVDEFQFGRKRRDGSRLDHGTGLSEPSIRSGLDLAEEHGFLICETDNRDKGRIQKFYCVNLSAPIDDINSPDPAIQGVNLLPPEPKDFTPRDKESLPRTEKETKVRQSGEEKSLRQKTPRPPAAQSDQPFTYHWPKAIKDHGLCFESILKRGPASQSEYVFWMNGSKKNGSMGLTHYVKHGITTAEMLQAAVQMDREKLTIKSPASLWAFAWEIHRKGTSRAGTKDQDALRKTQAARAAEIDRMKEANNDW